MEALHPSKILAGSCHTIWCPRQNFNPRENLRSSSCMHQLTDPCPIGKEYVRTDGGNEEGCPIIKVVDKTGRCSRPLWSVKFCCWQTFWESYKCTNESEIIYFCFIIHVLPRCRLERECHAAAAGQTLEFNSPTSCCQLVFDFYNIGCVYQGGLKSCRPNNEKTNL